MSLYADVIHALGSTYGSEAFEHLARGLPPRKGLRKPGAYQASLTFKSHGLYIIFAWQRPDWYLTSAILFPGDVEGFESFPEPIEGRLPISSDRHTVHATLGRPSQSGGGGPLILGVLIDYHWDRYDLPSYSLRVDYQMHEERIRIVSLMTTALAAQLNPSMLEAGSGAA